MISGNTHKTFPGPQKGLLAFGDADTAARANSVINRWLFSSTHSGSMIALAVTMLEMERFGFDYTRQIVLNSNALGAALTALGFDVRRTPHGAFSENHQVHLFCDVFGSASEVSGGLAKARISANVDSAIGGRAYLRIGTQELTRRGMGASEMEVVASFLGRALMGGETGELGPDVSEFAAAFRHAAYSFDVAEDRLARRSEKAESSAPEQVEDLIAT